jgi:hypothetical protein
MALGSSVGRRNLMAWEGGMTFCFVNLKHKQTWLRPTCLAIASLVAVTASCDHGDAANGRNEHSVASVESRTGGDPVMAIVSLILLSQKVAADSI